MHCFYSDTNNKIHILIGDDDLLVRKNQLKPLFFKYAFYYWSIKISGFFFLLCSNTNGTEVVTNKLFVKRLNCTSTYLLEEVCKENWFLGLWLFNYYLSYYYAHICCSVMICYCSGDPMTTVIFFKWMTQIMYYVAYEEWGRPKVGVIRFTNDIHSKPERTENIKNDSQA